MKSRHTPRDDHGRSTVRPSDSNRANESQNEACRSELTDKVFLLPTERPAPVQERRSGSSFIVIEQG